MQNTTEKKFDEIKDGKYEFLIQGVKRQDSNGYDLKLKTGHSYQKLRIILLTNEKNHYVYKPIFSIGDIKEVVNGIGNPALTFVFESNPEKFELETLIGESGFLFLGHKEHNGVNYPKVECFIKPKANAVTPLLMAPDLSRALKDAGCGSSVEVDKSFSQELDESDGVPF